MSNHFFNIQIQYYSSTNNDCIFIVRQDCTWKDWAPWSSCKSEKCEFNPYNEDRSLDCSKYCRKKTSRGKNPEKYGGKPCAGNAHKDTRCNIFEEGCNGKFIRFYNQINL